MSWTPVVDWPPVVLSPQPIDPTGEAGPTKAAAAGPAWTRTAAGLYVPSGTDRSLVEQRILEAAARMPEGAVITGWAALRLAGGRYFDGLAPDGITELPVPIALPRTARMRHSGELALIRSAVAKADRLELHDVPCAPLDRAVFDEVRRVGDLREAVVVIDMALVACFVTLPEIDDMVRRSSGRPGIELMRSARRLATTRSASPQETRMRLVWVLDASLPTPLCNWPIADAHGRYLGRPDLLCAELGVYGEYDGKEHRGRARHRQDVGRAEGFAGEGLEGFTVVGDLLDHALVMKRMLAAVDRAAASTRPRTFLLRSNPKPLWP